MRTLGDAWARGGGGGLRREVQACAREEARTCTAGGCCERAHVCMGWMDAIGGEGKGRAREAGWSDVAA